MTALHERSRRGEFHLPVMLKEVVSLLEPTQGGTYVDVTLGGGGYAEAILMAMASSGMLIGIDRDEEAIEYARERLREFESKIHLIHGRMDEIADHLKSEGIERVDGIVADLGVSSRQLDESSRGFSFQSDGPLDMRMDPSSGESAAELLRRLGEVEMETLIRELGEERYSRRIAKAISERTGIKTTSELAEIILDAVPPQAKRERIHPATRTFQALRIAVNDELGQLERFLEIAPTLLNAGRRLVVISYHSLEDRRV